MNKLYRLKKGREFQRVRATGKSWSHPLLVLVVTGNQLGVTKHGFAVGKRFGKAHARNRIKREIREAVRVRQAGLKIGYDLVWIARSQLSEQTSFWEIDSAIENLLKRARLLEFTPPEVTSRPKSEQTALVKGT
ncbi:ribonuclease P protein component [Candidatus Chlorohelix sp.]|uniref:ribonuclease P protein component n=1 Tax=Candidatus Chlorohelix sp. TaxID=3139201 RepID=UPI00303FB3F4